ncbi:divergent protein kinase domain 2A [Anabrus simplex]|uniref:divergent protein kinase domain 2A n=1 Tax=Anabrus simplex TaxID=316456 RepID=UPI0035A29062
MSICRRSKLWKIFLLGCIALVCIKVYVSRVMWPDLAQLVELEKCPACFGTSLCAVFSEGNVSYTGFLGLLGSKNVLFASIGDKKVVLKKLGHDWELQKLDRLVCARRLGDIRAAIIDHFTRPVVSHRLSYGLHLCPSGANFDLLLSDILHKNSGVQPDVLYMNIWTLAVINGEPLILQILDEREGWPVPKYYGACGRVVVEEYVGNMLSFYFKAPWFTRAKLAYQLLVAAHDFTDKHPHFRFYLTDVSMDNIAVDEAEKVKFIDVEDMIILDKQAPVQERPVSWTAAHVSEKFDCDECFVFSSHDICSHHISDHNYFAVCQQLLATDRGLLSSIPSQVLKLHPQLPTLVEECAFPLGKGGRFEAAQQLTALLANITETVSYLRE